MYHSHFEKQLLWFGIGFAILLLSKFISFRKLFSYSFFLYFLNICLLVLVLLIGKDINGSKAWLDFKFFRFQPSELMKLTYSLFLASFISKQKFYHLKDEFLFLLKIIICFTIPSILIFLEPDTGAIVFLGLITLVLLWNSPIHKRWLMILGILCCCFLIGFFWCYFFQKDFLISIIGTSFFYRVERILSFREGMQIENALIALGSAPFFQFHLRTTGIYIPESATDFIFALTANVFGIAGNIMILVIYLSMDWYLLTFLKKIKDKTKRLFTLAFITLFFTSVWINISMNLGLFPIIGIPLPFLSYGGSSTIVLFLFLAIIFDQKENVEDHLH